MGDAGHFSCNYTNVFDNSINTYTGKKKSNSKSQDVNDVEKASKKDFRILQEQY